MKRQATPGTGIYNFYNLSIRSLTFSIRLINNVNIINNVRKKAPKSKYIILLCMRQQNVDIA